MSVLQIPRRWLNDFRRLIRNFCYEFNDENDLLVANIKFNNYLDVWAPDGLGWQRYKNTVVTEGKNHLLDVVLHSSTANATWYVAPYSGNVSPSSTLTAATFNSTVTELGASYSESTRVAYDEVAASSGSTNNNASPATITAATDNVTIYGAGLLSTSTKQTTAGVLFAASKYSTARVLAATSDTLGIKWTISV